MTPEDILLSVAPKNGQAKRLVIAMVGDKEVFRDKINTDTSRDREKYFLKLGEETGMDADELKKAHESALIKRAESVELEAIETVAEEMMPRSTRPTFRNPVMLPGGSVTITEAARTLGGLLAATGKFYLRGGVVVRAAMIEEELRLEPLGAAAACSDFESVASLFKVKVTKDSEVEVSAICSTPLATQIIESQTFRESLPKITVLSACPVLIERDGKLVVVDGYDRESGIWASGEKTEEMSFGEAHELLNTLVAEFNFVSPGDRSRALAAIITPALVFGGLLGGRAPIDLGEADQSQSGKGFRYKLTAAVYRSRPRPVTQRERGVGSIQENFDKALVSGACFIYFDNLRGKFESAAFESFMTEPVYFARIPYGTPMEIDATRTVVGATTNKAELTRDMTNRCSVSRITKQADDFQFRKFPEGDLLDHVQANQAKYLGAVFAVIREWHKLGKPRLEISAHDFRRWATTLGWIVENLLGEAPLVEGHRAIQERMSNPAGNWLRDVVLAVKAAGKLGERLRAHHLLNIVVETGIKTPGIAEDFDLADEVEFKKGARAIGTQIGKGFAGEIKCITTDGITITKFEETDASYRPVKEYEFQSAETEHFESQQPDHTGDDAKGLTTTLGNLGTPQVSERPEVNPATPEPPEGLQTYTSREVSSSNLQSVAGVRGLRGIGDLLAGTSGDLPSSGVQTWEC